MQIFHMSLQAINLTSEAKQGWGLVLIAGTQAVQW